MYRSGQTTGLRQRRRSRFHSFSIAAATASPKPATALRAESGSANRAPQFGQLLVYQGGETGQTVVVWGGSTSVGSNAVQLAVAAGYEVVTTASPRNFDHVRALGASAVFDYNSSTVVQDIIGAEVHLRHDAQGQ